MYNVLLTEVSEMFGYTNGHLSVEIDATLATRPEEIIRRAASKDAIVIRNITRADSALIRQLRDSTPVKVIGRLGAGLDNIDVSAARDAGLHVVYTPDANTESTAQYAFAQIMSAARNLPMAHSTTAAGQWKRIACMGRELGELTTGIVGFGRIGGRLADMMSHFGSRILVSTLMTDSVPAHYHRESLEEVFSNADVISLHVPLTPHTRGFVNQSLLSLIRPNAIFVNASRGEVVNEEHLAKFLASRPDVTAILDVRAEEPPQNDLFRDLPNVRLSPHIGAFTTAAQKQVLCTVLDDVQRVLAGGPPLWPAP